MATVDYRPQLAQESPFSGDWESYIPDLYDVSFDLRRGKKIAYKIDLGESTVSISKIVAHFRLTPVGTPTSRSLVVEFYEDDPTVSLVVTPISTSTDTTVYTDVRYPQATMQSQTIQGRYAYIVIYDDTLPETAYYQIDHVAVECTVTAASKPSVSAQAPPRGQTKQGEEQITFAWTFSGDGSLSVSELDWSTDNANWTAITHSVSGTSKTVDAYTFPRGDIYWRVRSQSSYGLWSEYSYSNFKVQYATTSQIVPVDSPTSGRVPANEDLTFSVALETDAPVVAPITLTAAAFCWRAGQAGDYTQEPMSIAEGGLRASVTVQFPEGAIEWYASGTDSTGSSLQTATYALTAMSSAVEVTPLAPIDSVESGSSAIVFRWAYSSLDGSPQDYAELEMSTDGETWETLDTVTGADVRSYSAAAQRFPAGLIYWHIRAASAGGATSPWSEAVSFIALAAPAVTDVAADTKPFATITWQVAGQLAYEIEIDGKSIGTWFGADVRSHTLSRPLEPGAHTVRVRSQNQYGLWSEWAEAAFITETPPQTLTLHGTAAASAALWWDGAETDPSITTQPVSMSATEGLVCFFCEAVGEVVNYQWRKKPAGASDWSIAMEGVQQKAFTEAASAELDGCQYFCRVSSAAGYEDSEIVTFTYEAPEEAPGITRQPADVYQTDGVVYLWCGTAGASAFVWYHRAEHSLDMELEDSGGDPWHIPYGEAGSGDMLITDGVGADWHLPAGSLQGAAAITDGDGGAWYIPMGTGENIPTWEQMDSELPYVRFAASSQRSGEEFFCRVTNEEGSLDSANAAYVYGEAPITPTDEEQYYIFRDGVLIGRSAEAEFEDRTGVGAHVYRVIRRLINNRATASDEVELTVALDCPIIAPLRGGEWIALRDSDKTSRSVKITRGRNVAYTQYAGARYPEAEIGEAESLAASFDAFWTYRDRAVALAFEALIGVTVIFKTQDQAIVGVLEGFDKNEPRAFRSYEFKVQQSDWGGLIDA